ncbi:MAG: Gene Transfer Agent associated protein Pden_3078, partial [uncultured Microvirga sp.]
RIDRASGVVSFPAGAAVAAGLRNRVMNGGFGVNQRAHASGAALAPGVYGHDRWKAGAGGCSYAFAQGNPDTTITLTSGSLLQAVENGNVEGGTYILSWAGSATARVGIGAAPSGPYAASPISVTAAAGQSITVEFSTGALGRVQLEPGSAATAFERRPIGLELALCQRYYEVGKAAAVGYASGPGDAVGSAVNFRVTKRAVPVIATVSTEVNAGAASIVNDSMSTSAFRNYANASGAGQVTTLITWAASAEL